MTAFAGNVRRLMKCVFGHGIFDKRWRQNAVSSVARPVGAYSRVRFGVTGAAAVLHRLASLQRDASVEACILSHLAQGLLTSIQALRHPVPHSVETLTVQPGFANLGSNASHSCALAADQSAVDDILSLRPLPSCLALSVSWSARYYLGGRERKPIRITHTFVAVREKESRSFVHVSPDA